MKNWLMIALLVGCAKKTALVGASTKAKKPTTLLTGRAMKRDRDLELQCTVQVDPEGQHAWVELSVVNHGNSPAFIPARIEHLWLHDANGRVVYAIGSPKRWADKPAKEPIYSTVMGNETRSWSVEGAELPIPPVDGVQSFACAASIGPDGTAFLQANGRAIHADAPSGPG